MRRNQLIDAARVAFTTHGYHGTTMATVGDCANVSKPVLYQHFSNKLDLYLTVLQQELDNLTTVLDDAIASADNELDSIRGTVCAIFDLADRNAPSAHDLVSTVVPDEPSVQWRIRNAMAECATIVARGMHPDDREPARSRLLAFALLGACLTASRDWRQAGRPLPKHQAAETATEWYWAGLRRWDGRTDRRRRDLPSGPTVSPS
ncbi:TetR/AcrR family transcriptional regulator [Nocardia sp. FBN12]|uniref:TetR/AcrR family transcriptional regulator n=1 Tax=Nocardia sp. FBN12 TaxID=3419766 RepID=UPI003D027A92